MTFQKNQFLKNLFNGRSAEEKADILSSLQDEGDEVNAGEKETDMSKETIDVDELTAKMDAMQIQLDKALEANSELASKLQGFVDKTGNEIKAAGDEFASNLIGAKYFSASAKEDLSGLFVALKDIEVSMGEDAPTVNGKSITDCICALFDKDGPADLARTAFAGESDVSDDESLELFGHKEKTSGGGEMTDEDIKRLASQMLVGEGKY